MKLKPLAALQVDLCKPRRKVQGNLLTDRSIQWRFYRGKRESGHIRLSQAGFAAMMRIAHDLYEQNGMLPGEQ